MSDLDQHLIDLETELLGAETRHNRARLEELLADDFREFGASGKIWDRPSVIAGLLSEPAAPASSLTATDFAVRHLSGDSALVTYAVSSQGETGPRHTLRSSIWLRFGDRWQMVFHQGTAMG